ncbi:MAG: hypothetical protein OHK93_001013 [Ramalina farinacea]|uniref:Tubulin-specific chaperone A n=1 Tax=Ramalina farinacea TaxID=258253 RepID=A0AA43QT01_9LECA|nr:hypothetical protein [Ramalina farinacea]
MPPASALSQATSSVTRLLKDLDSYDEELADQKSSLEKLQADTSTGAEGDDDETGNREYLVKQQAQAMKETQAVFKPLLERLGVASGKLEHELSSPDADAAEVEKAKEALAVAVQKQTSSTRDGV